MKPYPTAFKSFPAGKLLRHGFTLVEVLMAVAVVSTLSAMAVLTTVSVRESSDEVKLGRDVALLNRALKQYELFGGSLGTLSDPQRVLDKLKSRLTGDNKKEMAGLKGSLLDPRLKIELLPDTLADSATARARYRSDLRQFEIVKSGTGAIRRFVLDDALAKVDYGTESRATTLKLAKQDKWVWDFSDSQASRSAPGVPPGADSTVVQPTAPAVSLLTLAAPSYSLPTGTYPLKNYPMPVTILNPNASGISEVQYNVSGGPFKRVTAPVPVDPGAVVAAYATPLDLDKYVESPTEIREYFTVAETPLLSMTFTDTNLSYADMGGPILPSATPGPPAQGTLLMTNRAVVPDVYENSTVFLPQWTYDGSDPLTSSTAVKNPDFTGGYTGSKIPVSLTDWKPGASTMTLQAATKTLRPDLVTNSAVKQVVLTREVRALPPPAITFAGRDCTLSVDLSGKNVPVGVRLYYTIDGSDPGDNAGEPLRGTLYTGPFLMEGNYLQILTVSARTYPPSAYKEWFTTSIRSTQSYKLPASVDVYVGGDFYNGSGSAMRNIARLTGAGALDTRFDTGSGASPGSLVGVIRQASGGILAGGDFEQVNGAARPGIVRLRSNGTVDTSFDAGLVGGN